MVDRQPEVVQCRPLFPAVMEHVAAFFGGKKRQTPTMHLMRTESGGAQGAPRDDTNGVALSVAMVTSGGIAGHRFSVMSTLSLPASRTDLKPSAIVQHALVAALSMPAPLLGSLSFTGVVLYDTPCTVGWCAREWCR